MLLWLTHSSEISVRDQIVRQISLGILSGELSPGEKLSSVRELARRFNLHRNTVSSAYRQLEEENWVMARKGSGVYVRPSVKSTLFCSAQQPTFRKLDGLFQHLVIHAQKAGLSEAEIFSRLEAALKRSGRTVLVEDDTECVNVLVFEIASAGRTPPEICYLPAKLFATQLLDKLDGRVPVVMPSRAEQARIALGKEAPLSVLQISPVASSFSAHLPRSRNHLVAIASHWPRFLEMARTLLISAGFESDSLIERNAREEGWHVGLDQAANVICDSLTRSKLPEGAKPIVFRLLSQAALERFPVVECDTFETGTMLHFET
jgi:GntR family transcriptional regulator